MMLTYAMTWLLTELNTLYAQDPVKGYPIWSRAGITVPCVSVELWGLGPSTAGSVGRPAQIRGAAVRVTVWAANEPALWDMCQTLATWLEAKPTGTDAGGRRFAVALGQPGMRYQSQTGAEQEQYGMEFTLSLGY